MKSVTQHPARGAEQSIPLWFRSQENWDRTQTRPDRGGPNVADEKTSVKETGPTAEEKLAAAEAEVDALVKKGLKALDEFEKLDQKQVDHIMAKASIAAHRA